MFPHPVHVITSSFPLQLLEIFFGNQLPCISLQYNAMHSICVPQKNSVVFQSHDCINFVGGRGVDFFNFVSSRGVDCLNFVGGRGGWLPFLSWKVSVSPKWSLERSEVH